MNGRKSKELRKTAHAATWRADGMETKWHKRWKGVALAIWHRPGSFRRIYQDMKRGILPAL